MGSSDDAVHVGEVRGEKVGVDAAAPPGRGRRVVGYITHGSVAGRERSEDRAELIAGNLETNERGGTREATVGCAPGMAEVDAGGVSRAESEAVVPRASLRAVRMHYELDDGGKRTKLLQVELQHAAKKGLPYASVGVGRGRITRHFVDENKVISRRRRARACKVGKEDADDRAGIRGRPRTWPGPPVCDEPSFQGPLRRGMGRAMAGRRGACVTGRYHGRSGLGEGIVFGRGQVVRGRSSCPNKGGGVVRHCSALLSEDVKGSNHAGTAVIAVPVSANSHGILIRSRGALRLYKGIEVSLVAVHRQLRAPS